MIKYKRKDLDTEGLEGANIEVIIDDNNRAYLVVMTPDLISVKGRLLIQEWNLNNLTKREIKVKGNILALYK